MGGAWMPIAAHFGPLVAARCVELAAVPALIFRPSLSWAVQDTLFSYWRLPRALRREIDALVPHFLLECEPEIAVQLDWKAFKSSFKVSEDGSKPVGHVSIAWALALHAEHAFDADLVPKLEHPMDLSTNETIAHSHCIRRLLSLITVEEGDYYMAFVVLITVLEKALYDLFQHHHHHSGSTTKKKNMILRDLLHSEQIQSALPPGMMALLKILFLPSGLNLRNIVWHGFLVPAQFPRCFACLTAMLLLELPRFFPDRSAVKPDVLFQLHSFDDRFLLPVELVQRIDLDGLIQRCEGSGFVPQGRERLVLRALQALNSGDELWFLFALLPVLEHALRVQFVVSNRAVYPELDLEQFCVAQIDQYYSTLDGFGQRDKHQVLLHAEVSGLTTAAEPEPKLNALYQTMPRAALAVCLDLFMMASGPNVRAKLCHGEADLATLLAPSNGPSEISVVSQLVLLTWTQLCDADEPCELQRQRAPATRPRRVEPLRVMTLFESAVDSSFHPFLQLKRLEAACQARLDTFGYLRETWGHARAIDLDVADGEDVMEPLTRLTFFAYADATGGAEKQMAPLLVIMDKAPRIREFACFFDSTVAMIPVEKPKTFAELLVVLDAKIRRLYESLCEHAATTHVDLQMVESNSSVDRCLLALSDTDGLSVSACMLEILSSMDRSLASFESRIATLSTMIQDATARTSQRRAFLNNAFLLPVFERIQRFAFDLVCHQIYHMETIAHRHASKLDDTVAPSLCPNAVQFEQLQRKLLQFVTAFEGCTGSAEGAQKSSEKALQLALQFLDSKPVRAALTF